ncbi:FMN-binding negative transcriptional regulator [Ideonella sp. DXS22W]|uniref:FMN-binding negative transcriptional regulator n=1 Tax=Pseudaquabacterium inlustre TaxID=2984192 RepID=A0ABU9CEB0_9BURK
MYLPRHFEEVRPEALQALMQAHPMGLLVTAGAQGAPVADALPFLYEPPSADAPQGRLLAHVARANPLWQAAQGREVLVVFQGPQGYVSPGWYPSKAEHGKVVPTWNYAMVQARGTLRAIDDAAAARDVVERLTARHEAPMPAPWAVADAPADYLAAMLRAIVAIEIPLSALTGKFKLSQNRSEAERQGVVSGLGGLGPEAAPLAAWTAAGGPPDAG